MADFPRSLPEFQRRFPNDAACAVYLVEARWPEGFICLRIPTDPTSDSDGIRPPVPTACDHLVVARLRGGLIAATGFSGDVIFLCFGQVVASASGLSRCLRRDSPSSSRR